ncbi:MAG: class III poly(R)-hydroxyalkanoic acid synthase subunit PhaE [Candidatus Thiodiazotropha weberae]|nr:class III poly(R)-hydroxyalkanoic acid synthase subunit PhaE [Candidatus Thiodiazotropha lotti]MCG8013597.1 class III poly(R)-hydroxyalkanoic acid synthase subunit PhaE [Candidatus Thiodiazotropha lotti]MCG8019246.1 class III poly(R)-hydroxyalkanoic acid synthase subunit PhaE [Candidatus Thiodiazotropha lotti]MCW4206405.1 class III poly(R)-hydroxyalkanoic acid synthase subunit PhaE [Candidatus Thiodiazotropha lotti]MCW4213075.1 class III poly(R)-hydroxyalkanoic acid synthase subunit PhaE [Ca
MSESAFWNEDWMKIQQSYWENWNNMSRKAMGMEPPKSPLESAMDHWWQAVSPSASDMSRDFMGKMMEQSKSYFRLAEGYFGNAQDSNNWLDAANRTVSDMQSMFSNSLEGVYNGTESAGDDAVHKMMAFWEMPMDNWQRMVSSLSLMPGDLLRNMPHQDGLERFLSAPGLGYMREEEGQYKKLTHATVNYQRNLGEYMKFFTNLGLLAANRMKDKIQDVAESGKQIDSARGLYDLWVSSSEEVYGEQVMTPEYAKIHGSLVNSLMNLKQRLGHVVDEALGGLNMPTRRELRTLQDRLQESRRESKAMKAEIELLKEQMIEMRSLATSQPKAVAAETAAKPKATVKKKASAKKKAATKKAQPKADAS